MLFLQIIDRLEMMHDTSKQFLIHRDIKPDNFLMGLKINSSKVHVIDFGLSKSFRDKNNPKIHIPFATNKSLLGSARFASIHAHKGHEQSRRDDLESLGYMMIFFLTGSLPWSEIEGFNMAHTFDEVQRVKASISMQELCKDCPREF